MVNITVKELAFSKGGSAMAALTFLQCCLENPIEKKKQNNWVSET